jgi:hypothetical protein
VLVKFEVYSVNKVCMLQISFRLCGRLSLTSSQRRLSSLATMVYSKPRPVQTSKVLIFGAGNFGSCLASHLGDVRHEVHMWAREDRIVKHFNEHKRNPVYLPDHAFPTNINAVGPELPNKEFIDNMDVLLFAIPTQFLR